MNIHEKTFLLRVPIKKLFIHVISGLELNFTATWGDLHYLGMTGIEVVGKEGETLPMDLDMITASPRDLHHLPGHELDDRTLDK